MVVDGCGGKVDVLAVVSSDPLGKVATDCAGRVLWVVGAEEVGGDWWLRGWCVAVPEFESALVACEVLELRVELVFGEVGIDGPHIALVVGGRLLGELVPLLGVEAGVEGEGEYGVDEELFFHFRLLLLILMF